MAFTAILRRTAALAMKLEFFSASSRKKMKLVVEQFCNLEKVSDMFQFTQTNDNFTTPVAKLAFHYWEMYV